MYTIHIQLENNMKVKRDPKISITYLSNGRLPYMCATLFTKKAILSTVQNRQTKTVQNANHKLSFQK